MSRQYDVSHEEWLIIYETFQACLRNCAETHSASLKGCRKKYPVPPNENVSANVECQDGANWEHRLCTIQCSINYLASLGFEARPELPSSSLSEEVKNVKKAATDAAITFLSIGAALGTAGIFMRVVGKSPISSLNDKTKKWLEAGGLGVAGVGGLVLAIGGINKLIGNDPPDPQFQEMARLRQINLDDLLTQEFSNLPFFSEFAPLVYQYLQAFQCIEAFLLSLEKSAGAAEAGDTDKELAHIRVAREYARGFADSLGRAGAARIEAASKLEENLLVESSDDDNSNRVIINLDESMSPDDLLRVRPSPRTSPPFIIPLQDAIDIHTEWTQGTLDEIVSHAIDSLASEKYDRADMLADLQEFIPSSKFFDQSPAALLTHPDFDAVEADLLKIFAEFASSA